MTIRFREVLGSKEGMSLLDFGPQGLEARRKHQIGHFTRSGENPLVRSKPSPFSQDRLIECRRPDGIKKLRGPAALAAGSTVIGAEVGLR